MAETLNLKLLLVDDIADNRFLIHQIIKRTFKQLEVVEAESGPEAIELAKEHEFALVLLDVQMPEMDGYQVAQALRANPKSHDTPIIFVTAGKRDADCVFKGYQSGAVDYLLKPFSNEILQSKVKVFLELYEKNKRLETFAEELKHEIQHRKQAEADREALQAEIGELQKIESLNTLLAGVSHEFNNALGYALGFVELLVMKLPAESKHADYALKVQDGVKRGVHLVDKLLAFCDQAKPHFEPITADKVVLDIIGEVKGEMPESVHIQHNFEADVGQILADRHQLGLVIKNILDNAVQATAAKEQREIKVNVASIEVDEVFVRAQPQMKKGSYVLLSITDNGEGMNEATVRQAMDPFFTTHEVGGGTGLGLSVVQGIIKGHGGTVLLQSEIEHGTTVNVFLPMMDSGNSNAPFGGPKQEQGHILLVDHDDGNAFVGKAMLEQIGFEVTLFRDTNDSLISFEQKLDHYDCLILDVSMDTADCLQFIESFWAVKPKQPIVFVLGLGQSVPEFILNAEGKYDTVHKPYVKDELTQTLEALLLVSSN